MLNFLKGLFKIYTDPQLLDFQVQWEDEGINIIHTEDSFEVHEESLREKE